MRETGQCARLNRRSVPPSFMTSCSRSILIDQFGDATGTINRAESQRVIAKRPEHMGAWDYCQRGFWHVHKGTRADGMTAFDLFKSRRRPSGACPRADRAVGLRLGRRFRSIRASGPGIVAQARCGRRSVQSRHNRQKCRRMDVSTGEIDAKLGEKLAARIRNFRRLPRRALCIRAW